MPWKECHKMDERVRFVSRRLEGESIFVLCREFGISRITGHKLVDRYKQHGIEALSDRSRRPYLMANQLPLYLSFREFDIVFIIGLVKYHKTVFFPVLNSTVADMPG